MKFSKRFLFWVCLGILCIFFASLPTSYDYDLFARLIVGENFIEQGILPYQDFLSYTPTHPWYDHEWGSGVIFYLILKYANAFGLLLFYAIILFGISFFVIKTQRLQKHSYPTSLLFLFFFLTLFVRENHSLVRCQLFSFFLFSVFLYLLEKYKLKQSKLIWLIPFITIFWNNVHGGVVAGLGLVFMYFIGSILEKKNCKEYLYVLLTSTPLLVINPYGVKYLNFLFSATTMNRKFVTEWWPFYKATYSMISAISCILTFFISAIKNWKVKPINYTKYIVLIVTIAEGLMHVKLMSLALIAVASLCYNDILYCFRKLKPIFKKLETCIYPSIIILAFCLVPLFSPQIPRVDLNKFPFYEVEFLKINDIKGNLLTTFGHGSFVSYKLYPNNLIYMDGRYEEVYNNKEFYTLGDFELADTEHWDNILKNYNTEIVMVPKNLPAYDRMQTKSDWVHIYDGILCGIFVKKDNVKTSYFEPSYDINYYRENIFKTDFIKTLRKN